MKLEAASDFKKNRAVRVIFTEDKSIHELKCGNNKDKHLSGIPVDALSYFNGDTSKVALIPAGRTCICGMGDAMKLNPETMGTAGICLICCNEQKIDELVVLYRD